MSKNSVLCNLHIKACFHKQENPSKMIQNDYMINNQWFRVICIILHNLQNTNLQTVLKNSVFCNFQIKACLNQHTHTHTHTPTHTHTHTQKHKKINLNYYLIIISDLGWLILFCLICRTQIRRPYPQRNLLATLSLIINNKKKKVRKKKIHW